MKQDSEGVDSVSNKVAQPTTQSGFSTLQLLIVIAIVGVASGFAVINIRTSSESLSLQNSVRQLAGHIEKARIDAIRRHDTATIIFTTTKSYSVTMDFDGSGTPSTRSYDLLRSVELPPGSPLPSISFNWRGRTSDCTHTFAFQTAGGLQSWVDVSGAGDVTVNSDVDVLPAISYGTISTTLGIAPTTVVTGSGTHNNALDCSEGSSGVAGPPVSGDGSGGCQVTADPSSLSIKKKGGSTGSIVVSSDTAGTVTTSAPANLAVSPTSQSITANGSVTFSVTSLNITRGTFAVDFGTSCTTVTTMVKVTN